MRHLTLAKTNRYLRNRVARAILLGRTTISSAAVEGIHTCKHTRANGVSPSRSKHNSAAVLSK